MPINITFGDFDTVCYSNQHNIIELINHMVNVSIELNIVIGSLASIQSQLEEISQKADEGHDALLLGQALNRMLSEVSGRVNHIWNDDYTFRNDSALGQLITELDGG